MHIYYFACIIPQAGESQGDFPTINDYKIHESTFRNEIKRLGEGGELPSEKGRCSLLANNNSQLKFLQGGLHLNW